MLAAVAVRSVDEAVPLAGAGVGCVVLLTPSEETLVTGTGKSVNVDSGTPTAQDRRDWVHNF